MSTVQRGFNWFYLDFKIEFIFPQSKKMCGFFLSGFLVTHELPQWPGGKESICNAETRVQSLGWEESLEEEMATHSSILTWKISMGRGVW